MLATLGDAYHNNIELVWNVIECEKTHHMTWDTFYCGESRGFFLVYYVWHRELLIWKQRLFVSTVATSIICLVRDSSVYNFTTVLQIIAPRQRRRGPGHAHWHPLWLRVLRRDRLEKMAVWRMVRQCHDSKLHGDDCKTRVCMVNSSRVVDTHRGHLGTMR